MSSGPARNTAPIVILDNRLPIDVHGGSARLAARAVGGTALAGGAAWRTAVATRAVGGAAGATVPTAAVGDVAAVAAGTTFARAVDLPGLAGSTASAGSTRQARTFEDLLGDRSKRGDLRRRETGGRLAPGPQGSCPSAVGVVERTYPWRGPPR